MPGRTWAVSSAVPCRYCGDTAYRVDEQGGVHPCCLAWRRVMSFGYPCPACQMARIVARRIAAGLPTLPEAPPPLPQTLPDGTPFVPDG